jgi:hypothetical protein
VKVSIVILLSSIWLFVAGCEPVTIMSLDSGGAPPPATRHPSLVTRHPSPATSPYKSVPPLDLPVSLRSSNYGGGSCLHAAFQDVLRWQHQERLAAYWRSNYGGGAGIEDIAGICNRLGLQFAYTTGGDAAFLEWASRTRRGAAIYWGGGAHAITFCGFVGNEAVVVDNNSPNRVQRMSRERFLSQWRASGGRAVTAVYSPTPPRPWIEAAIGD